MATHREKRRPPAGRFDGRLRGAFHGHRQSARLGGLLIHLLAAPAQAITALGVTRPRELDIPLTAASGYTQEQPRPRSPRQLPRGMESGTGESIGGVAPSSGGAGTRAGRERARPTRPDQQRRRVSPVWLVTQAERKPPRAGHAAGRRLLVFTNSGQVFVADPAPAFVRKRQPDAPGPRWFRLLLSRAEQSCGRRPPPRRYLWAKGGAPGRGTGPPEQDRDEFTAKFVEPQQNSTL